MTDLLAALLLGIIEGVTEFLPISSTGHLLIAERWLGHRSDLFNIAIQAGAILAVVLIYRERLWQLITGFNKSDNRDYVLKLAASFSVTAVLGIIVKKMGFELPETVAPIAWALIIGGFVMLGAEYLASKRSAEHGEKKLITWPVAILVGVAQVIAGVFPGTSRSAAAIFAALLFGTGNRTAATEFAFLIGIPTMFAATGYELLDVVRSGEAAGENWTALGVAFVTSAITAFVVVKWLLTYIQTHRFTVFSVYRIVLGVVLLAWFSAPGANVASASSPSLEGKPQLAFVQSAGASSAGSSLDPEGEISPVIESATASLPASTGASQAFEILRKCISDDNKRRLFANPNYASMRAQGMRSLTAAQRAEADRLLAAEKQTLELDRPLCENQQQHLRDDSIYELALRAALAGDREAAYCYVAADFPMSLKRAQDPAALDRYRVHARRMMQAGLDAGDWRMVEVALVAYNPMEEARQGPVLFNEGEGPRYAWMARIFPKGDAERVYGLMLLQSLGSPTQVESESVEMGASRLRDWISDDQANKAEQWAKEIFSSRFGGRRDRRGYLSSCSWPA